MSIAAPQLPDSSPSTRRAGRGHLWLLLALTLAGGVLRFATINHPPIWGDEAATFGRVCGSYQELLGILQYDGFVPLHYELLWCIGKLHLLTPLVLRFPPAMAGTLLIPAIYFLAVQMVSRRAALLAALFTTVSAYVMVYSHDAKMYEECWLFCTLTVACLLWWIRTGNRAAFLAWVASGLAASGLHTSGLIPIALGVVFALSRILMSPARPRLWMTTRGVQILFLLLGTALIASGPAAFYLGYNKMVHHLDEPESGLPSAIAWVEPYNSGRSGPDLTLEMATAHLYSWEWAGGKSFGYIPPSRLHWLEASGTIVLLLLAV